MSSMLVDKQQIKIFILYLLDRIGYPLDYSSVGAIVIQDGIVAFFDFAECFFTLVDQGHIHVIHPPKVSPEDEEPDALYEVSETGKTIARDLSDSLLATVRDLSYRSAVRHLSLKKREAVVDQTYRQEGDHYLITCRIRDKEGEALSLTIRADSKYQLDRMMLNYARHPDIVFRGIVALLSGDANYLFSDEENRRYQ